MFGKITSEHPRLSFLISASATLSAHLVHILGFYLGFFNIFLNYSAMKSLTDIMVSNISSKLEVSFYLPYRLVYFFGPSKYLINICWGRKKKKESFDSNMQCSNVHNKFHVKSLHSWLLRTIFMSAYDSSWTCFLTYGRKKQPWRAHALSCSKESNPATLWSAI